MAASNSKKGMFQSSGMNDAISFLPVIPGQNSDGDLGSIYADMAKPIRIDFEKRLREVEKQLSRFHDLEATHTKLIRDYNNINIALNESRAKQVQMSEKMDKLIRTICGIYTNVPLSRALSLSNGVDPTQTPKTSAENNFDELLHFMQADAPIMKKR